MKKYINSEIDVIVHLDTNPEVRFWDSLYCRYKPLGKLLSITLNDDGSVSTDMKFDDPDRDNSTLEVGKTYLSLQLIECNKSGDSFTLRFGSPVGLNVYQHNLSGKV